MVNVYLIVEDKYINEMLGVTTIEIKSTVLPAPHAGQVAEHHPLELRPTADNPALQLWNKRRTWYWPTPRRDCGRPSSQI